MPSYDCRADVGDMRYYRQNSRLPERLNPPDHAATCAVCKREAHDGSEIELTEHDGEKSVGTHFVCETCLDARLRSSMWRTATVDALDAITEAAHLSDDLHPLARAERVAAIIAERDSLRAQLAERQVVVPPYSVGDKHKAGVDHDPAWQCAHQAGYDLASSRAKAIDHATECVVGRDLLTLLEQFPLAVDAFLAESAPWTSPQGSCAVSELIEIAGRRLGYMLEQLAALREGRG